MTPEDIKKIQDGIVSGLKNDINVLVKESVYEQTKHKDEEVSGLHREINKKLDDLGDSFGEVRLIVDKHDIVIQEILEIYKTSSWIKKAILWIILFIPSVAAFIAGLSYIIKILKNNV